MVDTLLAAVGIVVKEPWANDISYEMLNYTLWKVQDGGDGCGYVALKDNIGVRPDSDTTVWRKAVEAGQSIYDLAVKYGHFDGTEEEFEAQYQAALQAAVDAASAASATNEEIQSAEELRVTAEQGRVSAENSRVGAEESRASAELTRENNEQARRNNESGRSVAEQGRATAEQNRVSAENDRVSAENNRADAEVDRRNTFEALKEDMQTAIGQVDAATDAAVEINAQIVSAENDRVAAESDRVSAEGDRVTAEQERATAETGRSTAETGRVTAEESRVSAETSRATAETNRETRANTDHNTATSDHETAASDHTTAASDHTQAGTDHERAESDHTQATADHAVMAGYDTRLGNVESEVSQLGQEVDEIVNDKDDTVYDNEGERAYYETSPEYFSETKGAGCSTQPLAADRVINTIIFPKFQSNNLTADDVKYYIIMSNSASRQGKANAMGTLIKEGIIEGQTYQNHPIDNYTIVLDTPVTIPAGYYVSIYLYAKDGKVQIVGTGISGVRQPYANSLTYLYTANSNSWDTPFSTPTWYPYDGVSYPNFSESPILRYFAESIISKKIEEFTPAIIAENTVDNLYTDDANKPLSARQGMILNNLISDSYDESIELTNYALLSHETFVNKRYNSSGVLETDPTNMMNSTSLIPLYKEYDLYVGTGGNADVVFFDENKQFLSKTSSYYNTPIQKAEYPADARYIAFTYYRDSVIAESGEFYTATHELLSKKYPSTILKKSNIRPIVVIKTSDTEMQVFSKMIDAFETRDCDVVFEFGVYEFSAIYTYMKDTLGWTWTMELPIGGNCRYYFNNSKLIATPPTGWDTSLNVLGNKALGGQSFELNNGILINNGGTYCVHDEALGRAGNYLHTYNNMKMICNEGSASESLSKCIGGGTGIDGVVIIDGCIFLCDFSSSIEADVSWHGNTGSSVSSFRLIVKNSSFSYRMALSTPANPNETMELLYTGNISSSDLVVGAGWITHINP